jgi:hypothetical protein
MNNHTTEFQELNRPMEHSLQRQGNTASHIILVRRSDGGIVSSRLPTTHELESMTPHEWTAIETKPKKRRRNRNRG